MTALAPTNLRPRAINLPSTCRVLTCTAKRFPSVSIMCALISVYIYNSTHIIITTIPSSLLRVFLECSPEPAHRQRANERVELGRIRGVCVMFVLLWINVRVCECTIFARSHFADTRHVESSDEAVRPPSLLSSPNPPNNIIGRRRRRLPPVCVLDACSCVMFISSSSSPPQSVRASEHTKFPPQTTRNTTHARFVCVCERSVWVCVCIVGRRLGCAAHGVSVFIHVHSTHIRTYTLCYLRDVVLCDVVLVCANIWFVGHMHEYSS